MRTQLEVRMSENEIAPAPSKFPLFLLVCAQFVRGSVVLFVAVPLFKAWLIDGRHHLRVADAAAETVRFWYTPLASITSAVSPSLALIPVWLLSALLMGFIAAPFERCFAMVVAKVANLVVRRQKYFDPNWYTDAEYVAFVDWLFDRTRDKAHWEWELCHYFIYWSLPTALLAATIISFPILDRSGRYWTVGTTFLFMAFALKRSEMMEVVNQYYLEVKRTSSASRGAPLRDR